jgi:3',5'-cyclic-AMP phosphodiesterase
VTVVEHEAVRVVVLDSLLYVNQVAGLLGRAQRAWLEGYLPTVADRPAVLFVHHPPTDEDGDLLDGDRLLAILRANRHVKAIFHGHAHVWALGRRDRLHVVSLPALGYNFSDAQPVGWVNARFRRDGVSLTLRALAGNREDDGKTTVLEWER